MVWFIDLTTEYWTAAADGTPVCAFLNDDTFFETNGCHVFREQEEIDEHPQADRMNAMLPEGFFDRRRCWCVVDFGNLYVIVRTGGMYRSGIAATTDYVVSMPSFYRAQAAWETFNEWQFGPCPYPEVS